jgi:AcrR family transcriptional regulator
MVDAVAERGYGETRVVDVINGAGVSRKTFYELFADKEECFLAAYDSVFARFFEGSSKAYEAEPGASWAERVRGAFGALLVAMAADPAAARFAVIEVLAAGPKAIARRDAAMREYTHFVDAGRAETKLNLPGITSVAVVGGIFELLYSEILHGTTNRLPSRLPEVVFWITQPFLGTKRADQERERAKRVELAVSES